MHMTGPNRPLALPPKASHHPSISLPLYSEQAAPALGRNDAAPVQLDSSLRGLKHREGRRGFRQVLKPLQCLIIQNLLHQPLHLLSCSIPPPPGPGPLRILQSIQPLLLRFVCVRNSPHFILRMQSLSYFVHVWRSLHLATRDAKIVSGGFT